MPRDTVLDAQRVAQLLSPGQRRNVVANELADAERGHERYEEAKRREDWQSLVAGEVLNGPEHVERKHDAQDDVHDAIDDAAVTTRAFEGIHRGFSFG